MQIGLIIQLIPNAIMASITGNGVQQSLNVQDFGITTQRR